jgi:hypothetical protein
VRDICGSHGSEYEDRYDAVQHYYQRFKGTCFLQIMGKAETAETSDTYFGTAFCSTKVHAVTPQQTQFSSNYSLQSYYYVKWKNIKIDVFFIKHSFRHSQVKLPELESLESKLLLQLSED